METRAPAVVAVVVTTGAAPGLEPALTTLVGQGYEELSILVVANGGGEDVPGRVAAVAPDAFVKVLEENRGFAGACNEAAVSLSGADFLVFCHDDVLFFEGAIHALVEAAFRANAGIVTPKVVAYDDPFILLHVGQVADRFGTVRDRIELGEIDHGQHDIERDVFVAPGGVTLVRTDLFETLRGFDPLIPALGEDLDLCWRAQIAGARIIVAPSAVVAHRETVATGERPVNAIGTRQASRMDLQRRHQLWTVLSCWGPLSLIVVVPFLVLLDAGELVLSLLGRDTDRLGAITGAWRWVLRNRRALRERRKAVHDIRVLSDGDITRLQVGGASRLKTFFLTLFQDGLDRARGIIPHEEVALDRETSSEGVGFAVAFSEEESFDEIAALDDTRPHRRASRLLTSARGQIAALATVLVVWLFAVRDLIGSRLPNVGRLAPLDSWWTTWRHFFASWSINGVGTGTPGMPGYGVLAFAGTFTAGRMGVLPKLTLIAAVPIGAWGVWRLLRGVVSNRARLFAVVAYLAFPVGANLIESGRIDLLVMSAILPFAVRRLLVLLDAPGFRVAPFATGVAFGQRGFAATRAGHTSVLVIQVALMTAMAPVSLIAIELVVLSLLIAQWLSPRDAGWRLERPGTLALDVALGTGLLLVPMAFDTFAAGTRALSVFGLAGGPWSSMSVAQLVRGANGTFGYGWTSWLLPAVAVSALLLARGERRVLAVRLALVGVATITLAFAVGRNWLGPFAPEVGGLLVLLSLVVACLGALAVSAIENDLASWSFGWHQMIASVAVACVLLTSLPMLAQSATGRFNLPSTGTPESLGKLYPTTAGGYRILWLGDPRVLPVAGWAVAPGLAAATTTNGLPDGSTLFSPPDSGAADDLLHAVSLALHGETARLGQLIAPSGISAIVVMSSIAPTLEDVQHYPQVTPPSGLIDALGRQSDLALSVHSPDVAIYTNSLFHGVIAGRRAPLAPGATSSNPGSAVGWSPVMDFGDGTGVVQAGTVLAGVAPSDAFELSVNGHVVARSNSLGWAATYRTPDGTAELTLHQLPLNGVLAGLTLALWAMVLSGFGVLERFDFIGRRRRRPSAPAVNQPTFGESVTDQVQLSDLPASDHAVEMPEEPETP